MIFDDETLKVLKNFSTINGNFLFEPGNVLRTVSPETTVIASATVDQTFDKEAGVYDLSRFLSTISLFEDPKVEFGDKSFVIRGDRGKVSYTYTSPNMLKKPPKNITLPECEWEGDVFWNDMKSVIRAAGVLGVSTICFEGGDDGVSISAIDEKNPTSDHFTTKLSDQSTESFKMYIRLETLKMLPRDYRVSLSSAGIAHFHSENVEYWVALQS